MYVFIVQIKYLKLKLNWLKEGINCLGASYPINAGEYPQAGLIISLSFQVEVAHQSLGTQQF